MGETTAGREELAKAIAAEEGGRRWLKRGLALLVVAALVAVALVWRATHRPPPPVRFIAETPQRGNIAETVMATGTVNPLLQVNVGAQVSGRVTRVHVDFNSVVKKGDVLAEIDPSVYGAQVSQQEANRSAQVAQVASAEANEAAARLAFERAQRLFAENLASKADLDATRGKYEVARAATQSARAGLASVEAQLRASRANVGWTKIYSPVDGVVITRSVDPGQTVAASFQTPIIFVIAQDLDTMQVLAAIDEADVGKVKDGMSAEAVVDAFPGEIFRGQVKQLRYNPKEVQGVVTYAAVLDIKNPDHKLRPGMTATVTIKTREAKNVRHLPNAALRFKPLPEKKDDKADDGQPPGAKKPGARAERPKPPPGRGKARVYVLVDDTAGQERVEERVVAIGISDGLVTELKDGALDKGEKVVVDENDLDSKKKGGPF